MHPHTHSPTYPSTHLPSQPPSQPPTHSPSRPHSHSPTQPPTYLLTQPPTHSPTQPPTYLLIQPPTHSPTQPPSHPLTHPATHSPTQPPTHPPSHPATHSPTQQACSGCSLYVPIRRPCRLPRNYAVLADERLSETDYTHELCDVVSPFQRVKVLQSRQFGRVLTLDDDVSEYGHSTQLGCQTPVFCGYRRA